MIKSRTPVSMFRWMESGPSWRHQAERVLLGKDKALRVRTSMSLLSLMSFALFAGVQHGEVLLGLIDRTQSNWLTAFNLCGALCFYALVRSGASLRFERDPSLTLPQMVFALVSISWSYAITGPARGAVIAIMILVIMFGMFGLPPRAARRLALLGFVLLGTVMAWRAHSLPLRYPPEQELVHLLFAAIVLGATSALAIRVGRLRTRLLSKKTELSEALALNRELAARDPLTGLLNRRAMIDAITIETQRAARLGQRMSLALIDIDHFKRINDTLGHGAGDDVLRQFASILKSQLRAADTLARWGGEEFLLMMPGTRPAEARTVMERLRNEVAAGPFAAIAPALTLSFSAGLVELGEGETYEAAIDRADHALYRAKQGGRDRVELDGASLPSPRRTASAPSIDASGVTEQRVAHVAGAGEDRAG